MIINSNFSFEAYTFFLFYNVENNSDNHWDSYMIIHDFIMFTLLLQISTISTNCVFDLYKSFNRRFPRSKETLFSSPLFPIRLK